MVLLAGARASMLRSSSSNGEWLTRRCTCCGRGVVWPAHYKVRPRCDYCRARCNLYVHKEEPSWPIGTSTSPTKSTRR